MQIAVGSAPVRYRGFPEEKSQGATFTPPSLAAFVAKQMATEFSGSHRESLCVLDPAVGKGALLLELLDQLRVLGCETAEVHGFDTNPQSLQTAERAIKQRFPLAQVKFRIGDFLGMAGGVPAPPLFGGVSLACREKFDFVIANPPYVRTQIMGSSNARALAARFGLTGRIDLYHAFLLGIIEVLAEDGIAGVIVSNRFMTTKSGSEVRRVLREKVQLRHIWDLGDTKLFEAAVLPAVLLMKAGRPQPGAAPKFTSIYETSAHGIGSAPDAVSALTHSGVISIEDGRRFCVRQGSLDTSRSSGNVWRVATQETDLWIKNVEKFTSFTFKDVGQVRVGIKTCADKVFIGTKWDNLPVSQRPELLRPLITHHVARRFRADKVAVPWQVLYPHGVDDDGRRVALELSKYPRSAAYLESFRSLLSARSYVLEAGREWYEIWVPQDPGAWKQPKLVFRDISDRPMFWLDLDGGVVNGDCYWMSLRPRVDDSLLWLTLAVSNSSFIEHFYDHRFNNKLYAGRRRFMSQYVEEFPLPDPSRPVSKKLIKLARELYDQASQSSAVSLEEELNDLVMKAFGFSSVEEISG